jgi:hypothetical protein
MEELLPVMKHEFEGHGHEWVYEDNYPGYSKNL